MRSTFIDDLPPSSPPLRASHAPLRSLPFCLLPWLALCSSTALTFGPWPLPPSPTLVLYPSGPRSPDSFAPLSCIGTPTRPSGMQKHTCPLSAWHLIPPHVKWHCPTPFSLFPLPRSFSASCFASFRFAPLHRMYHYHLLTACHSHRLCSIFVALLEMELFTASHGEGLKNLSCRLYPTVH